MAAEQDASSVITSTWPNICPFACPPAETVSDYSQVPATAYLLRCPGQETQAVLMAGYSSGRGPSLPQMSSDAALTSFLPDAPGRERTPHPFWISREPVGPSLKFFAVDIVLSGSKKARSMRRLILGTGWYRKVGWDCTFLSSPLSCVCSQSPGGKQRRPGHDSPHLSCTREAQACLQHAALSPPRLLTPGGGVSSSDAFLPFLLPLKAKQ